MINHSSCGVAVNVLKRSIGSTRLMLHGSADADFVCADSLWFCSMHPAIMQVDRDPDEKY